MRVLIPTWEQQKLPVPPGNNHLQLLLTAQTSPSSALSPQQLLTPIPSSRCSQRLFGVETTQSATAGNRVTRREQDILHPISGCIFPPQPWSATAFLGQQTDSKAQKGLFWWGPCRGVPRVSGEQDAAPPQTLERSHAFSLGTKKWLAQKHQLREDFSSCTLKLRCSRNAAGKAPPPLSWLCLRPFRVNCLALGSAAIKHVLQLSVNSTHSLQERNSYSSVSAVAETYPERWNPAPSGECQSVYPADSTLPVTQVTRALLMYKNTVRRLPASGGSWSWQRLQTASTRSQISTDI